MTLVRPVTRDQFETITDILRHWANASGQEPVLFAPDRQPLAWGDLLAQLDYVRERFRELGVNPQDRVAIVLPDGPEMAAAFLTLASSACCAPLNPGYRSDDFEFYLSDLAAKALIVPEGSESAAVAVAQRQGVMILRLISSQSGAAGRFTLEPDAGTRGGQGAALEVAGPGDVALILHTSGTTSRPKMVPLTHWNLCSSARHVAQTLELTSSDRGLCVMPLFHIHGLIGALLSAINAGGSVVCSPGFSAAGFFRWLGEFRPTWFTAVPTMHQAILGRAKDHAEVLKNWPVRFIRSSSAALPASVLRELEAAFEAPVIESYGMTEASHQMASNPLPPAQRKPGSVGRSAGPEIAIMAESGQLLPAGEMGEIVIRGPNVTRGYANNPAANATAFVKGWFRTGDQGYLDPEGYLFISGRLKEIINRGGEKIAPRDVDEALLACPGVRQVVAFAVAHPTLGEDIAAAVVAAEGAVLTELELRAFAARRLPAFKVPSRILVLPDIPKGPTGKIQRIGLSTQLARELAIAYEAPVSPNEQLIAFLFCQILHRERTGRQDNFFSAGGDSIRAMQAASRLRDALGIEVPVALLFLYPTPALLGAELERLAAEAQLASLEQELEKLPPDEAARLLEDSVRDPAP